MTAAAKMIGPAQATAQAQLENPVEFPVDMGEEWDWFERLNETRPRSMGVPLPITETEMQAFFNLRGIVPAEWQLDLLIRLDRLSRNPEAGEDKDVR